MNKTELVAAMADKTELSKKDAEAVSLSWDELKARERQKKSN